MIVKKINFIYVRAKPIVTKLSGVSSPCMVSDLLEDVNSKSSREHETILKNVCFSVFNGLSPSYLALQYLLKQRISPSWI